MNFNKNKRLAFLFISYVLLFTFFSSENLHEIFDRLFIVHVAVGS